MIASTDARKKSDEKPNSSAEPLAALLRRTLLRSAALRSQVVGYAIEHTLSVDRFGSRKERGEVGHIARDMLDCFVRLAESIENAPVGHYSRAGNVIWLSKDLPVSVATLRNAAPEAVDAFVARVPEATRMGCDAETVDLLRECCLTHDFFSYAITSDVFENVALFKNGFHFVARVLHRARSLKKRLTRLELLYASARPVTWETMEDANPWERKWCIFRPRDSPGEIVYEGRRRVASLCGEEKDGKRARRFLEAGKREHGDDDSEAWERAVEPWVTPTFVREHVNSTENEDGARVERVAAFLRTAAAVQCFPEAFEVCPDAWSQSDETLRTRFLARFPHLRRVVMRVLRFRREREPPRSLCEAIVREAREETDRGGPKRKFSRSAIRSWASDETAETVARRLREDGCEEAAQRVETFASKKTRTRAWSFDTTLAGRGHVTWVDIVTSKKNAWDAAHGENATEIARTTERAYVVTEERELSFYRHPLSKLLTRDEERPLSSRMPELLVASIGRT